MSEIQHILYMIELAYWLYMSIFHESIDYEKTKNIETGDEMCKTCRKEKWYLFADMDCDCPLLEKEWWI